MKVKALRAGVRQKSDGAGDGWAFAYPGFNLRMKSFGERAVIDALADDVVQRIREAGLGQKSLGLFVLAHETCFARLLHQLRDVPLVSDGVRHRIIVVRRVEL